MNCCTECFNDAQIRAIITANNQKGDCNFCGKKDVFVYSVDRQTELSDLISDVINVYSECDDGDDGELLFKILINNWNIFNRTTPCTNNLIEAFCAVIFGDSDNHNVKVRIPHDLIYEYGIFNGYTWKEFSASIKTTNRFHNSFFNADMFSTFLTYCRKEYPKGTILYRARIWSDNKGIDIGGMKAPPFEKRNAGRVNPEGIGVLYLTTDEKTALSEVRASAFDFVSIAKFKLLEDITVINISGLNNISPISYYPNDLVSLAVNLKIFSDIAKEIARPLRRNDSILEYLPTQYISEFIKSQRYSGVEYASTMATGGINVAVFNENVFNCESVYDVEIKKLEYLYEKKLRSPDDRMEKQPRIILSPTAAVPSGNGDIVAVYNS